MSGRAWSETPKTFFFHNEAHLCLFVDELEKMFRECETNIVFTEVALVEKIKELDLEMVSHTFYTCFYITKTSLCNEHPLSPHFHIVNWGLQGYTFFSYFCSKTNTLKRF